MRCLLITHPQTTISAYHISTFSGSHPADSGTAVCISHCSTEIPPHKKCIGHLELPLSWICPCTHPEKECKWSEDVDYSIRYVCSPNKSASASSSVRFCFPFVWSGDPECCRLERPSFGLKTWGIDTTNILPWPSRHVLRPPVRNAGFVLITFFTTVSVLLLDQLVKVHEGGLSLGDLFSNSNFRNVVWNLAEAFAGLILLRLFLPFFFFSLMSQPRSLILGLWSPLLCNTCSRRLRVSTCSSSTRSAIWFFSTFSNVISFA